MESYKAIGQYVLPTGWWVFTAQGLALLSVAFHFQKAEGNSLDRWATSKNDMCHLYIYGLTNRRAASGNECFRRATVATW